MKKEEQTAMLFVLQNREKKRCASPSPLNTQEPCWCLCVSAVIHGLFGVGGWEWRRGKSGKKHWLGATPGSQERDFKGVGEQRGTWDEPSGRGVMVESGG